MLPEDMQQLALDGVREILGKKKPALTKGKWTRAAEESVCKGVRKLPDARKGSQPKSSRVSSRSQGVHA